jgi:hypothetical protein
MFIDGCSSPKRQKQKLTPYEDEEDRGVESWLEGPCDWGAEDCQEAVS